MWSLGDRDADDCTLWAGAKTRDAAPQSRATRLAVCTAQKRAPFHRPTHGLLETACREPLHRHFNAMYGRRLTCVNTSSRKPEDRQLLWSSQAVRSSASPAAGDS